MVTVVKGNILNAQEDIICHQVNCQGVMGAGVAKEISTKWPIVKEEYQDLCRQKKHKDDLLGFVQIVKVDGNKCVANIFGQYSYGHDKYKKYTDYTALTRAFDHLRCVYQGKSLAFPYGFGCGLANGDWNVVKTMIDIYFSEMNVTIYKLS